MSFWISLFLCCVFYYMLAALSVGIVYHRALTHKSLKLSPWFEKILVILALPAGTPIQFVGNHRFHHAFSDTEKDPHSPVSKGFWYAHSGWYINSYNPLICILYSISGPLRILWDGWNRPRTNLEYNYMADDIAKNSFYKYISTPYVFQTITLLQALTGIVLFFYFWGTAGIIALWLTLVIIFNLGDSLNSITHLYGDENKKNSDHSRNNAIIALLTMGDGWHANHHLFPDSAKLGLKNNQPDPTFYIIKLLHYLGIAHEIKVPANDTIKRILLLNEK